LPNSALAENQSMFSFACEAFAPIHRRDGQGWQLGRVMPQNSRY
jgi:hypothetical protein